MKSNKPVNIRDIADKAGVSPSTVSRVLNKSFGTVPVAKNTQERVKAAAELLGYQPNIHAIRLFGKKSNVIGLVLTPTNRLASNRNTLPGDFDASFAEAQNGILDILRQREYHLMIYVADEAFIKNKVYLNLYRSKSVDGLLIWGVHLCDEYTHELHERRHPFVLMNSHQQSQANSCIVDNIEASRQLTKHLLDLGHRRIAYIKSRNWSTVGIERFTGFKEAMQQIGLFRDELVFHGDYSTESGREACQMILQKHKDVTAICCANDCMAIGAIETLNQAGIDVPGRMSVTGADGAFPYFRPSLTTFKPPYYQIGRHGTKWLIDRIETDENNEDSLPQGKRVFQAQMVFGNSTTRCPA